MSEIIFKEESFKIVGICMEIHRALGMGLKEVNYKEAMEIDFRSLNISYLREKKYTATYKDLILRTPYIADFIVYDKIVLEIKSATQIHPAHMAQALSYLAVSKLTLALVINFGERSLTWKRVVL